ncbi:MAG: hypothetical protein RLZZ444_369, partial [Pseudomonadota bacterium]
MEGQPRDIKGLGLLEVETVMAPEKRLANSQARSVPYGSTLQGYEIQLGTTSGPDCRNPYIEIDGRPDGAMAASGLVAGTYLHRLFDSDSFRRSLLAEFGIQGGMTDYRASVHEALDAVAAGLEQSLDPSWLANIFGTSTKA